METPSQRTGRSPPGRAVILVAEADRLVRHVAELSLQGAGHHVLIAADGGEALRVADSHPGGSLDLVIAGANLAPAGGIQLIAEVRERRPHVAAIVVCGAGGDRSLDSARLGVSILVRPFDVLTLLEVVDAALSERRR